MQPPEIEAIVDGYAAAKNAHDVARALAFCSEECAYENVFTGGIRVEGKENVAEFFIAFFQAFPDWSGSFEGRAVGQDSMALWGRMRGTSGGEFMGSEAIGKTFDVPVVFVIDLRGGQITRERGFFDLATLADQIGASIDSLRVPEPAAQT